MYVASELLLSEALEIIAYLQAGFKKFKCDKDSGTIGVTMCHKNPVTTCYITLSYQHVTSQCSP